MKTLLIVVTLLLVAVPVMVGIGNAQSLMGGPLSFNVSITEESAIKDKYGNDTGYRKLVTKVEHFVGHIDFKFADDTQDVLESIAVYDESENLVIYCLAEDVVAISAKANNTKAAVSDKLNLVATYCGFWPPDSSAEGLAILVLSGTMHRPKLATNPDKVTFSGCTVNGGANTEDNNVIFKGTFGSVVKPIQE